MLSDFKAFLARGNVLDLAIAVIIGAAFGAVIKTFTEGIVMPFVSLFTGGIDFKQKVWNLGKLPVTNGTEIEAAIKAKEPLIMYGQLNQRCYFVCNCRFYNVFAGAVCRETVQIIRNGSGRTERGRNAFNGNPRSFESKKLRSCLKSNAVRPGGCRGVLPAAASRPILLNY